MSNAVARPSSAWVSFAYTNVALAISMAALGIWFLPVDLWEKGLATAAGSCCWGS